MTRRLSPASRIALERSEPTHKPVKALVLDIIRNSNGITSAEIAKKLPKRSGGWSPNSFSGRITELKDEGKIHSSGLRNGYSILKYGRKVEQMSLLEVA